MDRLIFELFFIFYHYHLENVMGKYAGVAGAPIDRHELLGELWVQYMNDIDAVRNSLENTRNPHGYLYRVLYFLAVDIINKMIKQHARLKIDPLLYQQVRSPNLIYTHESDILGEKPFDELHLELIKSNFKVLNKKEQLYLVSKYLTQDPDKEPVTSHDLCCLLDVKPSSLRKIEERIRKKVRAHRDRL